MHRLRMASLPTVHLSANPRIVRLWQFGWQVTMREVVVTGIGPLLPNCASRAQLWRHLIEGRSQLSFEPAPSNDGSVWPVGRIRDFDAGRYLAELSPQHYQKYSRDQQLYVSSIVLARDDAHLDMSQVDP